MTFFNYTLATIRPKSKFKSYGYLNENYGKKNTIELVMTHNVHIDSMEKIGFGKYSEAFEPYGLF